MAQLSHLSWYEFEKNYSTADFFILPVGSIEQHGKHLPLGTDTMVAEGFAQRIAEATRAVVLPAVPLGVVFRYGQWPGTIAVDTELFQELVFQVGKGVHRNGGKRLLVISGHDENKELLVTVAQRLNAQYSMDVIVAEWAHIALPELCALLSSENEIHGGELLTSLMLHWHQDLVHMEQAQDHAEKQTAFVDDFHGLKNVFRSQQLEFKGPHSHGVSGFPTRATPALGSQIEKVVIDKFIDILKQASWV